MTRQREAENTTDRKELVETVDSKLDHVWEALRDAIDVTVTKETSNTSADAKADVIVDGKVVLTNVPTTALLALEKRLSHLKGLYQSIPTLDPSYTWVPDTDAELPGTMKTAFAQEGHKTEKVSDVLVLYDATDKFPAQVKEVTLDKNVAKVITDRRQSGMVSPATKARWLRPDFQACYSGEGSPPAGEHGGSEGTEGRRRHSRLHSRLTSLWGRAGKPCPAPPRWVSFSRLLVSTQGTQLS
jgi:hypothetical protein